MEMGWDFLYVPMRVGGKSARGYAFINFLSEAGAEAFRERWQARRLSRFQEGKPLVVTVADVQGFEDNVQHLRSKSADHMQSRGCAPVIIRDGQQVRLNDL